VGYSGISEAGLVSVQSLAAPAPSITFSAIPGNFNLLRLVIVGASSAAAEATRWQVRINGDSGSDYDALDTTSYNNNVNSGSYAYAAGNQWYGATGSVLDLPGANAAPGLAGILDVTIPAYAGTVLQKIGLWRSGYIDGAAGLTDAGAFHGIASWRSTAAITSVAISAVAGNLIAGTTASLYLS
jgi:hypothetical protein